MNRWISYRWLSKKFLHNVLEIYGFTTIIHYTTVVACTQTTFFAHVSLWINRDKFPLIFLSIFPSILSFRLLILSRYGCCTGCCTTISIGICLSASFSNCVYESCHFNHPIIGFLFVILFPIMSFFHIDWDKHQFQFHFPALTTWQNRKTIMMQHWFWWRQQSSLLTTTASLIFVLVRNISCFVLFEQLDRSCK
jgi:hypothetical protein